MSIERSKKCEDSGSKTEINSKKSSDRVVLSKIKNDDSMPKICD